MGGGGGLLCKCPPAYVRVGPRALFLNAVHKNLGGGGGVTPI